MRATVQRYALALILTIPFFLFSTGGADGQSRGKKTKAEVKVTEGITVEFTLSIEVREQIREYYTANPQPEVEALPPGIRKRIAKGKPLPPGIAKKASPQALLSELTVPDGYELVGVGVDVMLVELATDIIHDFLMDVIR